MRKYIVAIAIVFALSLPAQAAIDRTPEHSMLWNGFNSIVMVDSFAIVTTGEGLVVLGYDTSKTVLEPVSHLFLDHEPTYQKRTGDVITVRTTTDILYFVDISSLPTMTVIGQADIGFPFYDYALFGQDLYICNGFHGLWRYTMVNYGSLRLADSSMIGIHYTRVEIYGDEMYALDDYNGIMRYRLTGIGFGTYEDMLYVPVRANNFTRIDSTIVISLDKPKIMIADFGQSSPTITDTVDLLITPGNVFASEDYLIALGDDSPVAEFIDRQTLERFELQMFEQPDSLLQGVTFEHEAEDFFMIPAGAGGLLAYNLDQIRTNPMPVPTYLRPGPIMGMQLFRGRLYTGGLGNPLDVIMLDEDGIPIETSTMYEGLTTVSAIDRAGERLCVFYPSLHYALLTNVAETPNRYEGSVFIDMSKVNGMIYNDEKIDTLRSVFAYNETSIHAYTLSDSGQVTPAFDLTIIDRVIDIAVMDTILFAATGKGNINMYRIYRDFTLGARESFGLPRPASELNVYNDRFLVFSGTQMLVYRNSDLTLSSNLEAVLNLPFEIKHSAIDGDHVVAVGPMGFVVIDMTAPNPQVVDFGGRGGTLVAAENGIVSISNGNVVHIYDTRDIATDVQDQDDRLPSSFALSQNYPNPFNPSTTITYSLPYRQDVRLIVYNVLGQQVTDLVNAEQPAGEYEVVWSGNNDRGNEVASGVYLYRLVTEDFSESRKMILLK